MVVGVERSKVVVLPLVLPGNLPTCSHPPHLDLAPATRVFA